MGMPDKSAQGTKSTVKIMSNIFIAFLGAGVLGLPFAFKEAGVIEGTLIMAGVGLVSVKAMLLLIDCKYKIIQNRKKESENLTNGKAHVNVEMAELTETLIPNGHPNGKPTHEHNTHQIQDISYGDVGYQAMGHSGRFLVDLSIVISQVGFCCAYIIFISENLSAYITELTLNHWLLILLPPLALLTLLRHLSSLALSSVFAQLSNLLAFAVVFWFDFDHFAHVQIHPKKISIKGFPFFLAIAIYCYEGAGMILSLEASLAIEIRHKFKFYFKSVLIVVTALYISFGVCGYLSFGPETNPIITLNLPKGLGLDFAIIVKSCLCLGLFFTYPVMMFPVAKILEKKLLPKKDPPIWQGNVLRVGLVSITGVIVLAVPNFANLMALVGSTCCTLIAFTLPGVFHYKLFKSSITKGQYYFDAFLVGLGFVGAIVGTWDALIRLHEVHVPSPELLISYNNTVITPAVHIIDVQKNISHINIGTPPVTNISSANMENAADVATVSHVGPLIDNVMMKGDATFHTEFSAEDVTQSYVTDSSIAEESVEKSDGDHEADIENSKERGEEKLQKELKNNNVPSHSDIEKLLSKHREEAAKTLDEKNR